jgi:hypothetical protein
MPYRSERKTNIKKFLFSYRSKDKRKLSFLFLSETKKNKDALQTEAQCNHEIC